MKAYKWIAIFFIEFLVTAALECLLDLKVNITINLKWIIVVVVVLLSLSFFIVEFILEKNKLIRSKIDSITELERRITELNELNVDTPMVAMEIECY